ncbi:MAG TPA: wax ester/triacylglycerol synthase domain-containing protein, partial [Kineosporiaceae bacterium]|nr:wax ester/triacylglycerol synthase domain-containing protein [Kineosporiaceae bacterium]
MDQLSPMSVQDALWLTMDRPTNLMVVDGAMVLSSVPRIDAVRGIFRGAAKQFPVFRRRAVRTGSGWAWQDDPDFDVKRHVTRVRLKAPADVAALQRFVAEERSSPLPHDRPLWKGILVAPVRLDDGTQGAAVVTRFHHAMADGVRLTQVILSMCETDQRTVSAVVSRTSAATELVPVGAEQPGSVVGGLASDLLQATTTGLSATVRLARSTTQAIARSAGSAAREAAWSAAGGVADAVSAVVTAVSDPLGALAQAPGVVSAAPGGMASAAIEAARARASGVASGIEDGVELVRHPDRLLDALEVLGVEDLRAVNDLSSVTKLLLIDNVETVWTGKPGTTKAVAWSEPIPLDQIKAVGRAHGATLNDVLLTAIAGGLRRYLAKHHGQVDEVVWMVPVNLKPFEENLPPELGNYFALVFLPMPLGTVDPALRLREIQHRMDRIKHSDEAVLTFGLQHIVSTSPARMSFFLTNYFANKAIGVLTNVPGPRGPMTCAGVPVVQVVGFAPCSG